MKLFLERQPKKKSNIDEGLDESRRSGYAYERIKNSHSIWPPNRPVWFRGSLSSSSEAVLPHCSLVVVSLSLSSLSIAFGLRKISCYRVVELSVGSPVSLACLATK